MNGKLVLSGKQTGADKTITVTDGAANGYDLATELGFTETQAPANADFWVGTDHYTDRTSNVVNDVMAGVELTLRGTTGADTVSVVVGAPAADTDNVKAKVQAFVDQYNSTMDFIRVEALRGPGRQPDDGRRPRQGHPARRSGSHVPADEPARRRLRRVRRAGPRRPTSSARRASRPARAPARAPSAGTRSRASSRSTRPS